MSTYEEMYFGPEKFKHRAEELRGRRWQKKETIPWFYCREGGLADGEVHHGYPGKLMRTEWNWAANLTAATGICGSSRK